MSRVLVLRHARTAWNEDGRIQGRTDTPLSVAGREQVRAWRLPAWASGATWYASPLARARETAALLGHPAPLLDDRLVEMSFGAHEGRRLAELRVELGSAMADNEIRGLDFHPPGGETPRQVAARFAQFLAERTAGGGDLVVVAHKGILRAALVIARGWDMLGRPPVPIRDDHGFLLTTDADGRPTGLDSLPLRTGLA
jgi:broad specificity phosphatase PhoE